MLLNGATLNGAAINGAARSSLVVAFAAAVALASVNADAAITRYCHAGASCVSEVSAGARQHHTGRADVQGAASVLAVEPKQRFASASVVITNADQRVIAVVTRYVQAAASGTTEMSNQAWVNYACRSNITTSGEVSAQGVVTKYPATVLVGNSSISSTGVRRCFGKGAVQCAAGVSASGVHARKADAALSGRVVITAYAGYGVPSATMPIGRAVVYAYARQRHNAMSLVTLGRASVTANGLGGFEGKASITGFAQVYALPVAVQAAVEMLLDTVEVSAYATYTHMAAAIGDSCSASVLATAYTDAYCIVAVVGSAAARVETTINNVHEGYSDPSAVAVLTLNANGVVVAPLISHFDGSSNITAGATYIHHAAASTSAACVVTAEAVQVLMGEAAQTAVVEVGATAHWLWYGGSNVYLNTAEAEAFAQQGHAVAADIICDGLVVSDATYVHTSKVAVTLDVGVLVNADITRYGVCEIACRCQALAASIGNPAAADPTERTMRRPATIREMKRPFMDRTMRTTRV